MTRTLAVTTVLILAAIVAPLLVPFMMSVSDTPFMRFPPLGFTLDWYGKVITDAEVQSSLIVSIRLAAVATAGALLLGVPCAVGLVRFRPPGHRIVLGLVLAPLVVPLLVSGLALLRIFSALGSHNTFMHLAIGHIMICLPYVVRNVSNSLLLADPDLESAARVLGADRWATFRHVTWHQIRPGVASGAIFAFIVSFDDYPVSMWLADARQFPLPLFLETAIARFFDPSVAALSALMILVALAMIGVIEVAFGIRVRRFAS